MVTPWSKVFTPLSQKNARRLASAGLRPKAELLLGILATDHFRRLLPFEKLLGDLSGAYSRRINIQHRLVYQVIAEERVVKMLRMWTHYE